MSADKPSPTADGRGLLALGRLQTACAGDSLASLMGAAMSLSCTGRLRTASADGVVVEIPNPPPNCDLLGATAGVNYSAGEGIAAFVSEVTDVSEGPDAALLVTLRLPEELMFRERRSAVRVPVPRGSLNVAIVHAAGRESVRPVDVSLTGILIEVDEGRAPSVSLGDTVTLSIGVDAIRLSVESEVCRADGRRFGLLFTDDAPPDGMAKVMWKLQEARLPSR